MQATTYVGTLSDRVFPRTGVMREVLLIVGFALFTAVAAQISIPMWPVPLTGQTLAVLLTAGALGSKRGLASILLYMTLGLVGLPVYAGAVSAVLKGEQTMWATNGALWSSKPFWLLPSFGYIIGFVVAAWVIGKLAERGWDRSVRQTLTAMLIGEVIIYAFGIPWLWAVLKPDLGTTLMWGLWPFLPGDTIKLLLAAGVLPSAWALLRRRRAQ